MMPNKSRRRVSPTNTIWKLQRHNDYGIQSKQPCLASDD